MEERRGMSKPTEHDSEAGDAAVALNFLLQRDQLEALALRVADLLGDLRDDGFLDVDGAAGFLATTRKAVYHLAERGRIRSHRLGGRLLFDPAELREDVERGA
jgi:excisionase family DNA binding protein